MPTPYTQIFSGDAHTGIYLGFREEQRTDRDKKSYKLFVLGMQRTLPNGFGGEKSLVTELLVSKELANKGFVTLLSDLVNTEITLPVYVTALSTGGLARYVTDQAMQIFANHKGQAA